MPGDAAGSAARCSLGSSGVLRSRCDAAWRDRRVSADRLHSSPACVLAARPFAGMLDVLIIQQHPCLASGESICRIRHDRAEAPELGLELLDRLRESSALSLPFLL
jgi:hypothetical protein